MRSPSPSFPQHSHDKGAGHGQQELLSATKASASEVLRAKLCEDVVTYHGSLTECCGTQSKDKQGSIVKLESDQRKSPFTGSFSGSCRWR